MVCTVNELALARDACYNGALPCPAAHGCCACNNCTHNNQPESKCTCRNTAHLHAPDRLKQLKVLLQIRKEQQIVYAQINCEPAERRCKNQAGVSSWGSAIMLVQQLSALARPLKSFGGSALLVQQQTPARVHVSCGAYDSWR